MSQGDHFHSVSSYNVQDEIADLKRRIDELEKKLHPKDDTPPGYEHWVGGEGWRAKYKTALKPWWGVLPPDGGHSGEVTYAA
jgi:hypothetical protein